ncbi:GPW/gp25 family protein [Alphaproteobacteria bacterium]|nr:GPW/gp25 family protein [Alphaproteobacteria bacterium]
MTADAPFLRTGWSFPANFDREAKLAETASASDIDQSLKALFSAIRGERLMLPDFGLQSQNPGIFAPENEGCLKYLVGGAVRHREPRIHLISINFERPNNDTDGEVCVRIEFDIPSINVRSSYKHTFYLQEGTALGPNDGEAEGAS